VHHCPNRLYFLNAARFHPIEKTYLLIPEVIPFILLGTNAETLTMYFVFNGVHGYFQHSNIRLKLGPLNYIFSMTELHRWHHSKIIEESNTNYGNNLIVWDIVFGTFFLPKNREVATIGVYNEDYPKSYLGQCKAPFVNPPIDKPADYAQRPEYYSALVRQEAGLE
jgi:sterol desaturase/sphingolipid hydroxylase (fatty acid hydroxylase superfamily)